MTLLWHGDAPIGICVFSSPALSLRQRNRFFGLTGQRSKVKIHALNAQLVTLSRVVLHPVYRGAGLAASFIQRSCQLCPWNWIESLTQMGHVSPFFERAGFIRVGTCKEKTSTKNNTVKKSRKGHSTLYGGKGQFVSKTTFEKSQYTNPVYYIFDNRKTKPCTKILRKKARIDATWHEKNDS